MRTFVLNRHEDESGVSGTGVVAEGVEFSDGTVALRWTLSSASTGVYKNIDDVIDIHGHHGKTVVEWLFLNVSDVLAEMN